jgi:hypothetical protein
MDGAQVVAKTAGRAAGTGVLLGAGTGTGVWVLWVTTAAALTHQTEAFAYLCWTPYATIVGGAMGTLIGVVTAVVLAVYVSAARVRQTPARVACGIRGVSVGIVALLATLLAARVFTSVVSVAVAALVTSAMAVLASRGVARTYLHAEEHGGVHR